MIPYVHALAEVADAYATLADPMRRQKYAPWLIAMRSRESS